MPAVLSCTELLDLLRRHALLEPAQLEALSGVRTPQELGKAVLDRGWLTPFQVNRILGGKVQELFLGQYLLQAKLGEGGMGQVFRALDRTMHRTVALKLIRPDVLSSEAAVERFLKEIRAAASLDHPNIVRAYHAGKLESGYFLVMEYVEGTDLHRRIKDGHPLPITHVCDWVRQAAQALQHVAERGMVHRDVKPMNLLLSTTGVVKLLDLGLARARQLTESVASPQATRQGSMMGTPDYVAPEQIGDASSVDIRADIYSLGCTLYHLLAGSVPFKGDDLRKKLSAHLAEEPEAIERSRPDVPADVVALVRRMMSKEPADRPQMPREVADALTRLSATGPFGNSIAPSLSSAQTDTIPPSVAPSLGPTEAEQQPTRGNRKWIIAAGVVAVVALLLLLWNPFAGSDGKPDRGEEQVRKDDPKDEPGKDSPKDEPNKDRKPDPPLRKDEPEKPPEKKPLVLVPPHEPPPFKDRLPWQPAELVEVIGDERGRHWGSVEQVVWSGDGQRLASGGNDGIRIWDAATLREVAFLRESFNLGAFALSNDGKRFVLKTWDREAQVWDLSGDSPRKEEDGLKMPSTSLPGNHLAAFRFTPDGKSLLALTLRGNVLRWPIKRLDRVPEEVIEASTINSRMHALDGTGGWIARAESDQTRSTLFVRQLGETAGKEKQAAEFLGMCRSLALSPNGRFLAAASGADLKDFWGSASLRLWSLEGETPVERGRYDLPKGGIGLLTFSPDSKQLVGATKSDILVWQVGAEGPGKPVPLKGHAAFLQSLVFSPAGPVLASAGGDGMVRLWDLSREPVQGDTSAGTRPYELAFSPDGKELAIVLRDLATRTSLEHDSFIKIHRLDRSVQPRQAAFQGFLHSVAFSPDARTLVACGTAGQHRPSKGRMWGVMEVRDASTLKMTHEKGFEEDVFQAQFHDAGKLCTLLTVRNYQSTDPWVAFQRFETTAWKERGDSKRKDTCFGAFSSDGRLAMTREKGNEPGFGPTDEVVVWDLSQLDAGGPREKKRFALGAWPGSWDILQCFSPDGTRLAVSTSSGQIELWDPLAGKRLASNQGQFAKLSRMVFSPDGSLIAAVSDEKRVTVWRVEEAGLKKLREPWTFPGPVHALAFDASSHFLATANSNGCVYLLRVRE
jgi:serine/threonine protein kinase/WD40 repeat protein